MTNWARKRPVACLILALAPLLLLAWWTRPPPMPSYAEVRGGWRSSEAWLVDRDGRPLDTVRVDFAVRRLSWTPLDRVAPALAWTAIPWKTAER